MENPGQISAEINILGSPVAETALLLGRAVSGVYNKVMNFRALDPRDQRVGMTGGGAMDRRAWADFYDPASAALDGQRLAAEFQRLWHMASEGMPVEDATGREVTVEHEIRRLLYVGA